MNRPDQITLTVVGLTLGLAATWLLLCWGVVR